MTVGSHVESLKNKVNQSAMWANTLDLVILFLST